MSTSNILRDPIVLCTNCDFTFTPPGTHIVPLEDTYSKLRTNHYYHSSETDSIPRLLTREKAIVERYERQITHFQEIVRKLECQQAQHEKLIIGLDGFHAPIRQLPAEILAEIFSHIVRDTWKLKPGQAMNLRPLILGLVCARWRDVALSQKELWAHISLDVTTFRRPLLPFRESGTEGDARAEAVALRTALVLEEYLKRSLPLPLSFSVRGYGRCSQHVETVLQLLAAHSKRWRDVELRLRCDTLATAQSLDSIKGNLPLLERLFVEPLDLDSEVCPKVIQGFSDCPKLRTLATEANLLLPPLPLHQITRLYAETEPYYGANRIEHVLGLVRSLPQLSHLVVKCHAGYGDFDMRFGSEFEAQPADIAVVPGYLSKIRTLTVCSIRHTSKDPELHEVSRLYDGLTLPSLQQCILQTSNVDSPREQISIFDNNPWEPTSLFGTVPCNSTHPNSTHLPTEESLSQLSQDADDDACIWPQRAFISLLQRSSCPLETVIIRDFVIKDTELIEVLGLIPTLTTLKICEPLVEIGDHAAHQIITKHFLQSLSYSSGQITLTPRLSHIDFIVCSYADLKTDIFEMFESRWPSPSMDSVRSDEIAPLEFFQLRTRDGLTRVRALRDGGLRDILA